LLRVIQASGCESLAAILISHYHFDHVGGIAQVLKYFPNTPVYKAKRSSDWNTEDAKCGCDTKSADIDIDDPNGFESLHSAAWPDHVNAEDLHDGQQFSVAGATLTALHTPGHTTDHMCFYLTEENAIFSADCVLGVGTAVFTNLHTYMHSLATILAKKPSVMYPGHGPMIEDPVTWLTYYIDHRLKREYQILHAIHADSREALTSMQIVKIVYKDVPEHLHPAANNNVILHLKKCVEDGMIAKIDDTNATDNSNQSSWKLLKPPPSDPQTSTTFVSKL
jgi:endoribonuclease LACTB2